MSKTILVTGGAGFVGSNLCVCLLKRGDKVIAVDNFITSSPDNIKDLISNSNFKFFKQDVNYPEFTKIFPAHSLPLDEIYHLACPTGVPNCTILAEEMIDACSLGTKRVLELARDHNARVVVTSTAEAYGDPEVFPQTEDYNGNVSTTGERSAYEEGKRFTESIVAMFVRKYNLRARITRLFNAYGPRMSEKDPRVHSYNVPQAIDGQPLRVYGDGTQTRTFCYVDDTVQGLVAVMDKGAPGEIYNVGSDEQIQIRDLMTLIIELAHSSSKIEFKPHFIADHRGRQPSVEKLKGLGWERRISLEQGTQRMIKYFAQKKIKRLQELINL